MKSPCALLLVAGSAAVCASGQVQPSSFTTGQAARLVVGQTNFTTADFGATNSLLGSVSGIAYANGMLWVADANRVGSTPNNNRVLRFSDVSTYPSLTADPTILGSACGVCRGHASLVLGQPDFITNNAIVPPIRSSLRSPTGVATDGTVLAVADTDNNRVLIWLSLPNSNAQPADIVIGQADFNHNATSVPPNAKSLRGPSGVWIAGGKLYVADTQDNRVLIYNSIPTSNNAAADVVIGQANFTAFVEPDLTKTTATPAADNMQDPVAVTTDGSRMYVTDLGQNRVLIWNKIPTTNGVPADVAVGQPDLVSAFDNYGFKVTDATLDSTSHPKGTAPVLCQSNGTDSDGSLLWPARCAATISVPRYAFSDGRRLFVADGGNDRILIFNTIPTASGQRADIILGEPDEFSDNTTQNPDGTDAFTTPNGLAYDGLNLFVSDTNNRRVVVYTPAAPNVPLAAARNAASLEIFAIGNVTFSGNIAAKDTVTVTVAGKDYTYTIVTADTLTSVAQNLAKAINTAPDPNVTASVDSTTNRLDLTARTPGQGGASVTLTATASANAQIVPTANAATLNIYLQNPTSIAPGTVIEISGQNLCDTAATGDTSQAFLPGILAGCELFIDGVRAPLLYVSPTQINAQMLVEFVERTSVSIYVRNTHADGSITVTTPIAATIVPQNPGIFAGAGTDPRPGFVFHSSANATAAISIDGAINAGDVATITIGGNPYAYTVQAGDTLATVRDNFVNLINSAPDPNVTATAANEFQRIVLTANVPGPDGEAVTVAQTVTGTNASLVITVFNANLCCENAAGPGTLVTPDNPAIPGEILYVLATGLGPTNPSDIDSGRVFRGGSANPPATPVDSILTGGVAANILSATLVPGLVGVYQVQFQLGGGVGTDLATQMTIAQQAFVSNVVTFPVVAAPTSSTPSAAAKTRPVR
jgi:uncharacterized protein (TIGR03437 family)